MISGRACPVDYTYRTDALADDVGRAAEVLYVVGGLYGNLLALDALERGLALERGEINVVFNGDFNWFNVDPVSYLEINRRVLGWGALRGNVETELARDEDLGCGCGYPPWVADEVVENSNAIMRRLRAVASAAPALRHRLGGLHRHAVFRVGDLRVAAVHGDAESLAGWGFAQESLRHPGQLRTVAQWFSTGAVDVFACTHTCLPVLQAVDTDAGKGFVVNNGAAGMPNFAGDLRGLVTRIAVRPLPPATDSLYGVRYRGVFIDNVPVAYDRVGWAEKFIADWPPGSAAHRAYYERITHGPRYRRAAALRV